MEYDKMMEDQKRRTKEFERIEQKNKELMDQINKMIGLSDPKQSSHPILKEFELTKDTGKLLNHSINFLNSRINQA